MKSQDSQLFLKDSEGRRVPVSRQVYETYWRFTNKEDYFMRLLKEERFRCDPERETAEFLPSREDSLDRLMEEGEEFACDQKPVEDQVVTSVLVRAIMDRASEDERNIIRQTYVLGKSDEEASLDLGIPQDTYKSRKKAMLSKIRKFYDDSS